MVKTGRVPGDSLCRLALSGYIFGMRIEHVALYVKDLEGAKDFFEKYFGGKSGERYRNRKTGFSSYFIRFPGGTVDSARLEIMSKPDLESGSNHASRTGFIHLAFSLGSREKVDDLTERMENDGWEVISGPRTTGDGYYESCVSGFEGNLIEITI